MSLWFMWLVVRTCPRLRRLDLSASASQQPRVKLMNGKTRVLEGEIKKFI